MFGNTMTGRGQKGSFLPTRLVSGMFNPLNRNEVARELPVHHFAGRMPACRLCTASLACALHSGQ